ncbi:MAG TPA: hypothetical protein VJN43_13420 [Bryobacteraceae bacterium]|nr:hypothetical protein [Bryobacteraceae bacterium]
MSLPPISALEQLGNRPFSFYPPIVNVESNEWFLRRGTWSEILVVNSRTGLELWIPRRFMGEVSQIEDPVVIVGLAKELEYKAGAVWPHQRRVIEMPLAVGERPRSAVPATDSPAPVIGIRTESITDTRIGKLVGFTMLVGVVASFVAVNVLREGVLRPRSSYVARDQLYLQLTHEDDYWGVIHKLGTPTEDRWQSETGAIQFRSLSYPQRAYTVILMGDSRNNTRYIGTMDQNWNPIAWITLRTGGDTQSTLRGLKKF